MEANEASTSDLERLQSKRGQDLREDSLSNRRSTKRPGHYHAALILTLLLNAPTWPAALSR